MNVATPDVVIVVAHELNRLLALEQVGKWARTGERKAETHPATHVEGLPRESCHLSRGSAGDREITADARREDVTRSAHRACRRRRRARCEAAARYSESHDPPASAGGSNELPLGRMISARDS